MSIVNHGLEQFKTNTVFSVTIQLERVQVTSHGKRPAQFLHNETVTTEKNKDNEKYSMQFESLFCVFTLKASKLNSIWGETIYFKS